MVNKIVTHYDVDSLIDGLNDDLENIPYDYLSENLAGQLIGELVDVMEAVVDSWVKGLDDAPTED